MIDITRIGMMLLKTAVVHGVSAVRAPRKVSLDELMKDFNTSITETTQPQERTGLRQVEGVAEVGVTTDETVKHQKREMAKEMLLLEAHLVQKCKIHGVACDCCQKHPLMLEALANETIGITGDNSYREIANWAKEVAPIVTAEASASGQYDDQYPELARQLRDMRKKVMM